MMSARIKKAKSIHALCYILSILVLHMACNRLDEKRQEKNNAAYNRKPLEVRHHFLDFNKDGIIDTLLFLNFLYGPGIKENGLLALRATENVAHHDSSFYLLSDIYQ